MGSHGKLRGWQHGEHACLPAAGTAQGSSVRGSVAATATTTTTTAAAATATPSTTTTTPAATATTTAVADHLGKAGINLLLGFSENGDQVTGLLGVCSEVKRLDRVETRQTDTRWERTYCQW